MKLDGVSRKGLLKATTATATRFKLSATAHLAMVSSTINAAGGNMQEVVGSVSTSKRHRKEAQAEAAATIRSTFKEAMPKYKVIHWDGKVTEFLSEHGRTYQDANAVVLSAPLHMAPKFLGAPVVDRGTGIQLAEATMNVLTTWGANDGIIGMVFDTTSSNTGIREGAVTHIEERLGHGVLWLACRHHTAELHVKHPYDKVQGPTRGTF